MEGKHDFKLWIAAFPLAVFCTLIFLGDGADAMSPNTWLLWVAFCAVVFALLVYRYVYENCRLAWEAVHKGSESKLLFPPGVDPPTPRQRFWIYAKPFAVLVLTLIGAVGLSSQITAVYSHRVANRAKRDGIRHWIVEWDGFKKSLSAERPAPIEQYASMKREFSAFVYDHLTDAESALLDSEPQWAGGVMIRKFPDQKGEMDYIAGIYKENLIRLMKQQ